jgi:pyruvate,orthophosphate dikinase
MMSTVLNVGMNDETVKQLAEASGNLTFALDTYRRFLQMFGTVVLGKDKALYDGTCSE